MTDFQAPQPVAATHDYTPDGPWQARCRDVSYKGGDWPRDEFLQWEVYGVDEPPGRGALYREEALLVAAAPELLEALRLMLRGTQADCGRICMPNDEAVRAAFAAIAKATGAQA